MSGGHPNVRSNTMWKLTFFNNFYSKRKNSVFVQVAIKSHYILCSSIVAILKL